MFLRSRHGVGDGSDLGRISSQQVFLSSLVRTVKSSDTLTDFTKMFNIATVVTQSMTLSNSLKNVNTMVAMAQVLKKLPLDRIMFVQYPGVTGGTGIYANKVQPDKYRGQGPVREDQRRRAVRAQGRRHRPRLRRRPERPGHPGSDGPGNPGSVGVSGRL